ncbi:MAG: response regulator transcription factor [Kiritimatiellaeota bacterium]|nr:response regulator transcription factor [Kiritimatiellota bacterium]
MTTKNRKQITAGKKTILLVDDHPMLREGLQQFLQQDEDLTICGQAGSTAEAMKMVEELKPDLLVVDIGLPGRDGLELIKDIRAFNKTSGILVFSMFDEGLYAERALRAGAQGYVMKDESPARLVEAIRSVLRGEIVTGNGIVQRALRRSANGLAAASTSPLDLLTDRQLEIFRLIGSGVDRNTIAEQLNLSVKTVEVHRANIRVKLGIKSAADLLVHATQFCHNNNQ